MTEHRPTACHYDRALGYRVTTRHIDACPRDRRCPAAGRGCAPCTERHCLICGRAHATTAEPDTCVECTAKVGQDLADIQTAYTALAIEALDAGHDGRLVAAAPIPGGDAAVLIGPTVRLNMVRVARGLTPTELAEDHHRGDPIPPLAILAQWEDIYRAWLNHPRARRASVSAAIKYLRDQVPYLANHVALDGPDWVVFTRQIRSVRAQLERALHDEREPERGIECFECGDRLVRRVRTPRRCRHTTPARAEFKTWIRLGYIEAVGPQLAREARQPCRRPDCDQGGVKNPAVGLSWECPSCRKDYQPGEYANAVRRDLATNGTEGDGWTHITMAAEAATTMTGVLIPANTVRRWMDRGKVASMCRWTPRVPTGLRLVFWPDVADQAAAAVERAIAAEQARLERAEQARQLREAVDAGEDPTEAGKRLGIHPSRVEAIVHEWETEARSA